MHWSALQRIAVQFMAMHLCHLKNVVPLADKLVLSMPARFTWEQSHTEACGLLVRESDLG